MFLSLIKILEEIEFKILNNKLFKKKKNKVKPFDLQMNKLNSFYFELIFDRIVHFPSGIRIICGNNRLHNLND